MKEILWREKNQNSINMKLYFQQNQNLWKRIKRNEKVVHLENQKNKWKMKNQILRCINYRLWRYDRRNVC